METRKLSDVLHLLSITSNQDVYLCGISNHSKAVSKDWLFISECKHPNYYDYLYEALRKGAYVLTDQPYTKKYRKNQVIYDPKLQENHIKILSFYYAWIGYDGKLIGITGTNGKSSVASYLTQLLRLKHKRVLRIGTHLVEDGCIYKTTKNTTPDGYLLANILQYAKQQNIPYIVMELSSHAFEQNRLSFLRFDCIIVTTITSDHLDFHKTKCHYQHAKQKCRWYLKDHGFLIVNADDVGSSSLLFYPHRNMITVGTKKAHFLIKDISCNQYGASFILQQTRYHTTLLGIYNIYNVVFALSCMQCVFYELIERNELLKIHGEPGRMQCVCQKPVTIWIDYAHTTTALKALLEFANTVKKGKIYTIFGCGGNRDIQKRKEMATVACQYSDTAVFTADNPRDEPLFNILKDMCQTCLKNYEVYENRYFAINNTIKKAKESDIIIIAGKGNEKTQEIEGNFYPFHDETCVIDCLKKEEEHWK